MAILGASQPLTASKSQDFGGVSANSNLTQLRDPAALLLSGDKQMKRFIQSLALALLLTPFVGSFAAAQSVAGPADSVVYVQVEPNRELTGSIVELAELSVTTSFGEVKVPLSKVDGVKMNIGNDNSAVLAFKNGDMLTGKVTLDKVQLKTDWGTAHINTSKIKMISTDKNARFFTDQTSGSSGWRFTKAQPVPARGR